MQLLLLLLSALYLVPGVVGVCDNLCSSHGTCMTDDVCQCYDNWGVGQTHQSGDCSDRICPFELAWIDKPNSKGSFHGYAECAGRGTCNRETGECQCFDGFEGKACSRTTCPNDCSGHGTCEYMDDLYYADVYGDYSVSTFQDEAKTFTNYHGWDSRKTRGCICDPTYGDIDCSKKMCEFGTDPLDIRQNDIRATRYQAQQLMFEASIGNCQNEGKTFALKFKSKMNETFVTIPIVMKCSNFDLNNLVHDVQLALLSLPNQVINGITVAGSLDSMGMYVYLNVTFTGCYNEGPQHIIEVVDYECYDGCTPKLTGVNMNHMAYKKLSNVSEIQLADYNSYECGRRGKCDYTTGQCQCFTGYGGHNCGTQTLLQ